MTDVDPSPASPWAAGSTPYSVEPPVPAVSPGFPQAPAHEYPPAPKRSKAPLFVALGVVVALLLGGGAFAAVKLWGTPTGAEPEEALPASVAAFARLDLDPALSQQAELLKLVKKFPGRTGSADEIARDLFDGLDGYGLRYADAKPWLGQRFGVALYAHDKKQYTLLAFASTDDEKAKKALATARAGQSDHKPGFAVADGYAVIALGVEGADGQPAADAAAAAAKTSKLSGRKSYQDLVKKLPANQVALGWADLADSLAYAQLTDSAKSALDSVPTDSLVGQIALGAQATADGVDLRYETAGMAGTEPASKKDLVKDLEALPGNTAVGLVVQPLAENPVTRQKFEDSLQRATKPLGDLMNSSQISTVTAGLVELLRSTLTLSVTDLEDPAVRLTAQAPDAASTAKLGKALDLVKMLVKTEVKGNTVTVDYGAYQATGGTLADSALYRKALADRPEATVLAAYLDVQKLVAAASDVLTESDRANLAPVKAVGLMIGQTTGVIHIVIG